MRAFVRTRVVPLEQQIEEDDCVPDAIRQAAKDMGLFGFALPEVYGGLGLLFGEALGRQKDDRAEEGYARSVQREPRNAAEEHPEVHEREDAQDDRIHASPSYTVWS